MSNRSTGCDFLKCIGLAAIALSVESASLAQEQAQSPGDAGAQGRRFEKYPYELMVCDYVRFKLSRVDKRGKIIWEHSPAGKVWDFVLTDDNKLIYPIITDKKQIANCSVFVHLDQGLF